MNTVAEILALRDEHGIIAVGARGWDAISRGRHLWAGRTRSHSGPVEVVA